MRCSFTLGEQVSRLEEAFAATRSTQDFLFVDLRGTALVDGPLLTEIRQEETGAYVCKSRTGAVLEVFGRGATLAEALDAYSLQCAHWRVSPPCLPH